MATGTPAESTALASPVQKACGVVLLVVGVALLATARAWGPAIAEPLLALGHLQNVATLVPLLPPALMALGAWLLTGGPRLRRGPSRGGTRGA